VSEFSVVQAGFLRGQLLASAALVACISLVFAGVLYHFGRMALGAPRPSVPRGEAGPSRLLVGVPLVLLLLLGFWPPPLLVDALWQAVGTFGQAP
jgi:hydrogenase-4 component F